EPEGSRASAFALPRDTCLRRGTVSDGGADDALGAFVDRLARPPQVADDHRHRARVAARPDVKPVVVADAALGLVFVEPRRLVRLRRVALEAGGALLVDG